MRMPAQIKPWLSTEEMAVWLWLKQYNERGPQGIERKDRGGRPHLKRRTSRKKLKASLNRFAAWCRENRNLRLMTLFRRLNAKLRGYFNYYGVVGNYASLNQFFWQAMRILFKWLNRRSQRRSFNWQGFQELLKHFRVEQPRIVGRPKTRKAASLA